MKNFEGKLAVITGGGTGMGRELARQLVAAGCHVAMCNLFLENMAETRELCERIRNSKDMFAHLPGYCQAGSAS